MVIWLLIVLAAFGLIYVFVDGQSTWMMIIGTLLTLYIIYLLFRKYIPLLTKYKNEKKEKKRKDDIKRRMQQKGWRVINGGRKLRG